MALHRRHPRKLRGYHHELEVRLGRRPGVHMAFIYDIKQFGIDRRNDFFRNSLLRRHITGSLECDRSSVTQSDARPGRACYYATPMTTISWYPGHMHKANKELAKMMQQIDVVIEVLDARMPAASSNPLLHEMRKRHHKPCLHILNKADLADPALTREWIQALNRQPGSLALANGKDALLSTHLIVGACERLVAENPHAQTSADASDSSDNAQEQGRQRRYHAVIAGIPNVGKSTLLNQLLGRKIAKTGNEPAVTKQQQRVRLTDRWFLFDTPGVLWPRQDDQDAALRLATAGAIRNTAMVFEDVGLDAAEVFLRDFPDALRKRYGIDPLPETAEAFMTELAGRRGCRGRYGGVDWHKVAEILLHDYREGRLGRMTLEAPSAELLAGAPTDSPPPTPPSSEQTTD